MRIFDQIFAYVKTLLIQDILAEPEWQNTLTDEDLRGPTPLFWGPTSHRMARYD
ncbi:hypothetical protein GCM10009839_34850 [Catenulispora yoronensis]|uniref:Uncharacterized protein n=1 Tax=Catenulispora yoronensis TaxID=450799 RepID=A0ABN2U916_9ACTN